MPDFVGIDWYQFIVMRHLEIQSQNGIWCLHTLKKKKKAWPEKRVIAVLKYLISPDPRKMSFKLDTH